MVSVESSKCLLGPADAIFFVGGEESAGPQAVWLRRRSAGIRRLGYGCQAFRDGGQGAGRAAARGPMAGRDAVPA